jgi:hypothetical protein
VSDLQQLPQDIRSATALLEAPNASAPGGVTRVWVLGASHVSLVSCRQIKDLIRAVQPEVRDGDAWRASVLPGWGMQGRSGDAGSKVLGCRQRWAGRSSTSSEQCSRRWQQQLEGPVLLEWGV